MIPEFEILTKYIDILILNWLTSIIFYLLIDFLLNHKNKTMRIIQLALLPGVAIHELNHVIACKLFKVKVYNFDISKGYITSENVTSKSPAIAFTIAFAPLLFSLEIINIIQFIIINVPIPMPFQLFLNYIIVSITIAAGPSLKDTTNFIYSIIQNLTKFFRDFLLLISALFIYYFIFKFLASITQFVTFHILIVLFLMFLIRFLIQTVKQTLQNIKKKKYQHLLFLQNKRSRVNTIKASFLHDFMNKIAEAFRTVEKRKFAEERGKDLKTMSSEIIFDSNL